MEVRFVRLPILILSLCLLVFTVGGCESKNGVAQAVSEVPSAQIQGAAGKVESTSTPAPEKVQPSSQVQSGIEKAPVAGKSTEAAKTAAPPSDAAAALQSAMEQKKYLFVSFYKPGDQKGEEVRKAFAEAEGPLSQKALFYAADIGNPKEQVLVSKYQVNRASLPLTLAFAENGAIVRAFPGAVVDRETLEQSFVSSKLAEVQKGFQDKKIMLLCVQGKSTLHNAESMGAARELIQEGKTGNAVNIVEVAPEDPASTDLLKQLKVDSTLKEATVFVLVPPSNLAGKVEGATTKDALWKVILKGISACGGGSCCPSPAKK